MKKLLYLALMLFTLASCKEIIVYPDHPFAPAQPTTTANATPTAAIANPFNTTFNFDIKDQYVTLSLQKNVLTMSYNEKISVLVDTASLKQSWAVFFIENFQNTQLNNFNYTSVTKFGATAYNWVDGNLNNVVITSVKDTIVNHICFAKIQFARVFLYTNNYPSPELAVAEYDFLLTKKDVIFFTAYLTPASLFPTTYSASANLFYAAQ